LTVAAIPRRTEKRAGVRELAAAVVFPVVTTILAAIVIFAVFTGGVRRGMDSVIAWGPASEQNGMAVAISELVYGLNSYVAHAAVVDALVDGMSRGTDGINDPKFKKNLANPEVINEALAAAISLGPQPEGFVSQRSLRTMVYDDIGIVDYDKIAFSLFGFRIQSLYYLFFVILSLSAAAFILQFWRSPMAQLLLLCNLLAFWLELHEPHMFSIDMPSLWGMRHGSTLAILPMWHIALLLAYRARLSWLAVLLAVVQIAIIVLAMRIRGSAAWTVLFLAALSLFFAFQAWRNFQPGEASFARGVRAGLRWPFVLLLIGLAASKAYTDSRLHPAYYTDDIMPYHGAWHSAYLGVFVSDTLRATTSGTPETWGDRIGYDAALRHLRKKGFIATEAEYLSPWTNTYKMRLHDNTMKEVYLELVREYPFTTLGMYIWQKPLALKFFLELVLASIPASIWLVALAGALALALLAVTLRQTTTTERRTAVVLAFVAVLFASLPNMWAYANFHTIADLVLSSLIFVVLVAWTLAVALIGLLRGRLTRRG
jgi:hypothetical protein